MNIKKLVKQATAVTFMSTLLAAAKCGWNSGKL